MIDVNAGDLTTTLDNLAISWRNEAGLCTEAAAEAVAHLDEPQNLRDPYNKKRQMLESARLTALAGVWTARSREAAAGNLRFTSDETGDAEFMRKYGELIRVCRDQSRVVGVRDIDKGIDEQTGSGPIRDENGNPMPTAPRDYGNPGQAGPVGPAPKAAPGPGAPKDWGNPGYNK